jgi:hypothetical protein
MLSDNEIKMLFDNGIDVNAYDDIDALIDDVEDAVVSNILSNNDEPDETGIELEKIFDKLAYSN